ncbi:MAG: radical SAM protein [Bdellovibrionales bacterium]
MSFPVQTAEYANLKALSGAWGIAYGPIESRRLGKSLGINLSGEQKVCSFDCPYCELGLTEIRMNQLKQDDLFPKAALVGEAVRVRLRQVVDKNEAIDCLTISGNGEPTLHPEFLECVEAILAARRDITPHLKVGVLSNGAHCDNKRVVQALNMLDERMIKIDAGNEQMFKRINRPLVRANLSKITSGVRKLNDVIVQSLFVQGECDNTVLSDIEEWLEIIGIVKPKMVHITTISRVPAVSGLRPASEDTLYTIASRLKRKLQIECAVFP